MKRIIIVFLIIGHYCESSGQSNTSSENRCISIPDEISNLDIEDLYLGCSDCLSKPRLKADSFFKQIPLDTVAAYLQCNSYTVKYYAFLRVLALNDNLAFKHVKDNILDSTRVSILGACMSRTEKYNQLIASEYKRYIFHKARGQSWAIDGRTYIFTRSHKKAGKLRAKELQKLVDLYKLKIGS